MSNGNGVPRTDAEILYDVLDRLVHSMLLTNAEVHHRWSPIGSALFELHEKRQHAAERAWCVDNTARPPA